MFEHKGCGFKSRHCLRIKIRSHKMTFNNRFTIEDKLSTLQRWLIINSILYYRFNTSIIDDYRFNDECAQYCELRDSTQSQGKYDYAFQGFDGSTGFDLENNLIKEHHELLLYHVRLIMAQYKL